jgi:hypothetical protein
MTDPLGSPLVSTNRRRPLRILLADDQAPDWLVVQHLLRSLSYSIDLVVNGREALKYQGIRRRASGRSDAREGRPGGNAADPRESPGRMTAERHRSEGRRHAGGPGDMPRRRYGRLHRQAPEDKRLDSGPGMVSCPNGSGRDARGDDRCWPCVTPPESSPSITTRT